MEELYNKIDEVVGVIVNSSEYKKCNILKKKMSTNKELNSKINKIRLLQQEYVKSGNYDIKKELDELDRELLHVPIYKEYMDNLRVVNEKIDYVRDSLNDYFDGVFNKN